MSGPFGSSQWMYSSDTGFYPYEPTGSLRFEDGDSPYLEFTPSTDGNVDNWTFSCWFKRGTIPSASFTLFGVSIGTSQWFWIGISNEGNLDTRQFNGSDYDFNKITTALFRDPSAWYHIVLSYESGNATAEDRIKMYVNGERITSFGTNTNPSSGLDSYVTQNHKHVVGAFSNNNGGSISDYFDGYMTEVYLIDGTAHDADAFGELKNGVWVPKDAKDDLTFGTNGFYLPFDDSSAIGDDESGNTNDFTTSGLASTDVVLDSPTNNHSTLNPLHGAGQLIEGNLRQDGVSSDWGTRGSTFTVSSGKWYFEARTVDGTTTQGIMFGVSRRLNIPSGEHVGENSVDYSFYTYNATKYNNNSASAYGSAFADGDICGVALDLTAGTLTFYKNGTTMGVAFSSLPSGEYTFYGSAYGTATYHTNFGADSTFSGLETAGGNADDNGNGDFAYSPPSGHLALCTANLPNPTIDPSNNDLPEDYFNTVLYTGNGFATTNTQSITGVGFQPDWTWIKNRNGAGSHSLFDVVRGAGECNRIDLTEDDSTQTDSLTSFDSDGFSLGDNSEGGAHVNVNNSTYVAWNWLAGGSASSIAVDAYSSGVPSIASSVSANTKAGFSVVGYTGNGSAGTLGHGLNNAPEMYIVKDRDSDDNWVVYHKDLPSASYYLTLDTTNRDTSNNVVFNGTDPTDNVFSVGTSRSTSGDNYFAYCFHSVPGYSLVSSYTGNGSASGDGPFVHCGFRPAWVMVKASSTAGSWYILDSKRDTHNLTQNRLFPDGNSSESASTTNGPVDFLSNGFKVRSTSTNNNNASGQTYIFIAFAEMPFKYAQAR